MSIYVAFLVTFLIVAFLNGQALQKPKSHGFYRFFAQEFVVTLFFLNSGWFLAEPESGHQIASWLLLLIAIAISLPDVSLVSRKVRDAWLVGPRSTGLYRLIRYPLYTALALADWALFLKHPGPIPAAVALLGTVAVVVTGLVAEREGERNYRESFAAYRKSTKMFIPFIV